MNASTVNKIKETSSDNKREKMNVPRFTITILELNASKEDRTIKKTFLTK